MAFFTIAWLLLPLVGAALFFVILYYVIRKAVRDAYRDTHGDPRNGQ